MNIFGIGTLELAVIFLVAIIALGPGKTMETARTIGRIVREARRTFTEVMDAASVGDGDAARRRGNNGDGASAAGAVKPPEVPLESPAHLAGQAGDDDGRGDGGAPAGVGGPGDEGGAGARRSGQGGG